jgi:hypothetical protein
LFGKQDFFVTSESARYSASVDDKTTLLLSFDVVAIGAPHRKIVYPYTLNLPYLSSARLASDIP